MWVQAYNCLILGVVAQKCFVGGCMLGKVAGTVYGSLLNLILSLTLPAPAVATRRKETSCFFWPGHPKR